MTGASANRGSTQQRDKAGQGDLLAGKVVEALGVAVKDGRSVLVGQLIPMPIFIAGD